MNVNLSPIGGVGAQFFDNDGNVLSGGLIYTYAAGTSTPATTYTTSNGSIAHSNPIVLDSAGRVPTGEIWLADGVNYKFVLKDSNDVLIATYDNISGINSNFVAFVNQQEIATATAGQTVFNLGINYQPGTNSLSVFVDGVNQYGPGAQYSYIETDSTTVTFNAGLHVGAEVKFTTSQQQGAGVGNATQITYDPPFTGAVAENVAAKLAQTVSVKDFGAVGDGVTDDTAAIQAALDSGSKTVVFPEATYKVTSSLMLNAAQCLLGVNWETSVLKFVPSSPSVLIKNKVGTDYNGIKNINVLCDTGTSNIAQFTSSYGNFFKDVTVSGQWASGILMNDTYVCEVDNVRTTGVEFKYAIVGVGTSNGMIIRRLHTSGFPLDASTANIGVLLEFGKDHVVDQCLFQGQTIGIYIAQATETLINAPYFENTLCNIKTGDNTRGAESAATTIVGGVFSEAYSTHTQYASRGPLIYTPRTGSLVLVNPGFENTGNAASSTGPWPILLTTTTSSIDISNLRHFGGTERNAVMRTASGASPSLTMTGSRYGSNNATEVLLKCDGAFGAQCYGLRVDSSGTVSTNSYVPSIVSGTVSSLIDSAAPSVVSLLL